MSSSSTATWSILTTLHGVRGEQSRRDFFFVFVCEDSLRMQSEAHFPIGKLQNMPPKKKISACGARRMPGKRKNRARARARARVVYIIYTISPHESLQYQGVFNKMEKYPRFLRFAAFYGILPGVLRVLAFEKITEPTSRGKKPLRT